MAELEERQDQEIPEAPLAYRYITNQSNDVPEMMEDAQVQSSEEGGAPGKVLYIPRSREDASSVRQNYPGVDTLEMPHDVQQPGGNELLERRNQFRQSLIETSGVNPDEVFKTAEKDFLSRYPVKTPRVYAEALKYATQARNHAEQLLNGPMKLFDEYVKKQGNNEEWERRNAITNRQANDRQARTQEHQDMLYSGEKEPVNAAEIERVRASQQKIMDNYKKGEQISADDLAMINKMRDAAGLPRLSESSRGMYRDWGLFKTGSSDKFYDYGEENSGQIEQRQAQENAELAQKMNAGTLTEKDIRGVLSTRRYSARAQNIYIDRLRKAGKIK